MRQSLLRDFFRLKLCNLHGDQRKKEVTPAGSRDENVFDIMQGVAIALAGRGPSPRERQRIEYADLWGTREEKYSLLCGDVRYREILPRSPNFFFREDEKKSNSAEEEYLKWPSLSAFAKGISGIETKRDHFAIDQSRSVLMKRIHDFVDGSYTDAERKEKFEVRDNEWVVDEAVRILRRDRSWESRFVPCLHRPFDKVWIIYHGAILARDRGSLMGGMNAPNLGLVAARQSKEPFAVLATDAVCTHKIVTVYDRSFLFPLYIYVDEAKPGKSNHSLFPRRANLSESFVALVSQLIGLKWQDDGRGNLSETVGPEDIFHYAYAVFHSLAYRERYAQLLRIDFPRLPLPGSLALFTSLAHVGESLVRLHLLESPKFDKPNTEYIGGRSPEVEKGSWSRDTVWLDKAQSVGFRGVPEAVWNFHIGGYQVCEKWLKDRRGHTLTKDDLLHYQKIVVSLSETIRLMKEIDEVIERHGGWPGAFTSADQAAGGAESAEPDSSADVVAIAKPHRAAIPPRIAAEPVTTLLEASEPTADAYQPQPPAADEIDREELIYQIRQLFSSGGGRSRETAIRELAALLGYERVGPRIREELDNAIRTAVRRGILLSQGEDLNIDCRSIDDYERDFLKGQFLASLPGRTWTNRDAAIKGFARWLGFSRTGSSIYDVARSLINGLIRAGKLESDAELIRRL